MHTAHPQWESQPHLDQDDSLRTNCNESRDLGSSQPSKTVGKVPIEIPVCLRQYLTTTTKVNEIYTKLHESREKRLRLLLRRFTNQIQYGCKNAYCAVPTCLSYRKRHSDVPVRPYTDVAARALAWRCVEEYGSRTSGTVPDSQISKQAERKLKKKVASHERGNGLCCSEPVVPWYADPAEYFKGYRQFQQRHRVGKESAVHNVAGSPTKAWSPVRSNGSIRLLPKANGHVSGNEVANQMSDTCWNASNGIEHRQQIDGPTQAASDEGMLESTDLVPEQHAGPPKDTASFTQMLYDTKAIKSLDRPSRSAGGNIDGVFSTSDHRQHVNSVCKDIGTTQTSKEPTACLRLSSRSTLSFKVLNRGVLSWLLAFALRRPNDEVNLNGIVDSTPMSISQLAQESFYYCLSHPLRLLKSAESWRLGANVEPQDDSVNHDLANDTSERLLPDLDISMNTAKRETLPPLPSFEGAAMAFDILSRVRPYHEILDNIFAALQHAYILPEEMSKKRKVEAQQVIDHTTMDNYAPTTISHARYISDNHAASLCMVSLLSLCDNDCRSVTELEIPLTADAAASAEINYLWCREIGHAFPSAHMARTIDRTHNAQWKSTYEAVLIRLDVYDDINFLRLLESTANVISHRSALHNMMKLIRSKSTGHARSAGIVESILEHICQSDDSKQTAWTILDLMCVLLLKRWDKKTSIKRTSPVGGALQLLAGLYRNRSKLKIPTDAFAFKFIADTLDSTKMPCEWLAFRQDNQVDHIMSYSFLFDPASLVKYFRAINLEIMRRSYEHASINFAYAKHFLLHRYVPTYVSKEVLADLRPQMARVFVITVRRQNMLEDAINQIWRRQHQELLRPLKVNLGKSEGEDGLDHGGVQQEFFRCIFAEVLNNDYGMFTIDGATQMTWFQPGALEPLYKFEALGILMSLAIYNSVTLPLTFPIAFYRKLLGHKVKRLEHIEDGWPELTKGLRILQTWPEGDVGDVIARTYEFSFSAFGTVTTVDMSRIGRHDAWPASRQRKSSWATRATKFEKRHSAPAGSGQMSSDRQDTLHNTGQGAETDSQDSSTTGGALPSLTSTPEAPLVTNANREQYIKDYIFWLTDKSIAPQFHAFANGFHTCLNPTALSIFTPEALKTIVEGHTEIDIDELQASATYIEFTSDEEFILDLWSIIRDMSPHQHKQLLEFVTACDRVPVNGISSITFIVQNNGADDERLPSSSTCYGRLLLPKYSSKQILRAKLEKAIENSIGFGSL